MLDDTELGIAEAEILHAIALAGGRYGEAQRAHLRRALRYVQKGSRSRLVPCGGDGLHCEVRATEAGWRALDNRCPQCGETSREFRLDGGDYPAAEQRRRVPIPDPRHRSPTIIAGPTPPHLRHPDGDDPS